jgi:hypothetical protein
MRRLILMVVVYACALLPSRVVAETFNFDTGTPGLSTGQNAPFDQTSGVVTAHFSAPAGAGIYSIQTDASTGFTLTQFSGHYLYPNNPNRNLLDIKFTKPLSSITFTFATADFPPIETPTPVVLTAYVDSTGNPAVGSAIAQGVYNLTDTLPMGTLSFSSLPGQSFNLVEIGIQPGGGTGFLLDNITVTLVPEPSSLLMILSGLLAAAFRPPTPSSLRPYPSIPSRQPA